MNLYRKVVLQAKKPNGLSGILITRLMNRVHDKLTNWGLKFVMIKEDDRILDIGCGGGRTINKLSGIIKNGKVHGIDYSDASVNVSSKLNRKEINDGKVEILKASVSSIPFPDNYFDIITAIESYFMWPDLEHDMKEVLRVLKPNGKLLIVSETFKNGENKKPLHKWITSSDFENIMHFQTKEEFNRMFVEAGYKEIEIRVNSKHGWLCGTATKL